jgi:hypothetical protein
MSPTKQTSGKNVTSLSPAQRKRTNVPAIEKSAASKTHEAAVEVLSGASAPVTESSEPTLRLIVASEQVRRNRANKVAGLMARNGALSASADRTFDQLAEESINLRCMFPAVDAVKAVLGEDAPDLAGRSNEYRTAVAAMNELARDEMIKALRADGFTVKAATGVADQELERIRKSVTRSIRIAVETEAKAIMAASGRNEAARFVLGHGFGYSGEVTSKSYAGVIEEKSWKLVDGQLALPEGKVIGEDGRSVVAVNQQAEPAEQSDQATPGETADKAEAQLLGDDLLDPQAIINQAIGMLNRAAGLVAGSDLGKPENLEVRNTLRAALLSATSAAAKALVPAPAQAPASV